MSGPDSSEAALARGGSSRQPDAEPARAAAGAARHPPFVRRVVTVVGIATLTGLLLAVLALGLEVFLVTFAGVLLAVFLRALTRWVSRHTPLSESWALAAVVLLIPTIVGVGGWLLAPTVAAQAEQVAEQLPQIVAELRQYLERRGWGRWLLSQVEGGEVPDGVASAIGPALSAASLWFVYLLTFLFVGLFGAASSRMYEDGIVRLFPLPSRKRVREVLGEIAYTLRWWLIGRAVAMLLVGVTTAIVLAVVGMPFAVLLGLLAGLFTFVPYLGPIAAGVPIVLLALLEGPQMALVVLLAYTGIQTVEGYGLDPLIMQRLVYIPPVLTLVMQVLMAVLVGVIGVAMATPLAAVLTVLTRVYRRDVLGERPTSGGDDPV
jgi:predicted PurR-regulated permease PerM